MKQSEVIATPQAHKARSAEIDLIVQMKKMLKVDESRYRDELCFPYYRGYLEGQLKMIRFVETIFREKECTE
jgi:hypothetical protein